MPQSINFAQTNSTVYINSIKINGNNRTKGVIIYRELSFGVGDTLSQKQMQNKINESKRNLLNTPLFNFVNFEIKKDTLSKVDIIINVEERWYLWPQASIYYADRNFSNWLRNKDLTRTDLGLGFVKYNARGRNEKFSFYYVFGYDNEFIVRYNNVYIDKKRRHSVGAYFNYLRRKETGCIIENDKLKQVKLNDKYALTSFKIDFKYLYRKEIYNKHLVNFGFENRKLSDSLLICNPNYTVNSESDISYFYLKYKFISDKRNSRIFPTKGYLLNLTIAKYGFSVFQKIGINSFYIKSEISKYSQLSERFSVTNHLTLKYKTENKNAFFLNSALGYTSNIRGYEYYVINGTQLVLTKHTFNYKLLSKKVIYLKRLAFKRFNKIHFTIYASVFADAAYVKNSNIIYNSNNTLANTLLYSSGISLNLLTYYDAFFRLDYSVNHLKESGFYFHLESSF